MFNTFGLLLRNEGRNKYIAHQGKCTKFWYAYAQISLINAHTDISGAAPGFLERGLICIKVWGFNLLI